jgi:hypothetical protein
VDFEIFKPSEAMIRSASQRGPDSGDSLAWDSATAASSHHSLFQGILTKPADISRILFRISSRFCCLPKG